MGKFISEIDDHEVDKQYNLKIRELIKKDMRLYEQENPGKYAVRNGERTGQFDFWYWSNAHVVDTRQLDIIRKLLE